MIAKHLTFSLGTSKGMLHTPLSTPLIVTGVGFACYTNYMCFSSIFVFSLRSFMLAQT